MDGENVISGYTILQPRTEKNPLSGGVSHLPASSQVYRSEPLHQGCIDVSGFIRKAYVGKVHMKSAFERGLQSASPKCLCYLTATFGRVAW
jgi:hypothetical protein